MNGQVFVFAMNMMDFGGGLFPFALYSEFLIPIPINRCKFTKKRAGVDVILVSASPLMDPLKWSAFPF
jgi:hypothetical protein